MDTLVQCRLRFASEPPRRYAKPSATLRCSYKLLRNANWYLFVSGSDANASPERIRNKQSLKSVTNHSSRWTIRAEVLTSFKFFFLGSAQQLQLQCGFLSRSTTMAGRIASKDILHGCRAWKMQSLGFTKWSNRPAADADADAVLAEGSATTHHRPHVDDQRTGPGACELPAPPALSRNPTRPHGLVQSTVKGKSQLLGAYKPVRTVLGLCPLLGRFLLIQFSSTCLAATRLLHGGGGIDTAFSSSNCSTGCTVA